VRQRGSHTILLKPEAPGSSKGPTYPIAAHNPTIEISVPIIKATLRAFKIDEGEFWRL
jgi:hypothetical protein